MTASLAGAVVVCGHQFALRLGRDQVGRDLIPMLLKPSVMRDPGVPGSSFSVASERFPKRCESRVAGLPYTACVYADIMIALVAAVTKSRSSDAMLAPRDLAIDSAAAGVAFFGFCAE